MKRKIKKYGNKVPLNVKRDGDGYRLVDGYVKYLALCELGYTDVEIRIM